MDRETIGWHRQPPPRAFNPAACCIQLFKGRESKKVEQVVPDAHKKPSRPYRPTGATLKTNSMIPEKAGFP